MCEIPEGCCPYCGEKIYDALTEPMRDGDMDLDVDFYVVDIVGNKIDTHGWTGSLAEQRQLEAGLCHTTREAAQQWLDWWNDAVGRAEDRKD